MLLHKLGAALMIFVRFFCLESGLIFRLPAPLLSTKNEFLRDDVVHRAAFENAKRILASGRNITFFDLKSLMRIITDASQVGLLQKQHAEEVGRWSKPDHDV